MTKYLNYIYSLYNIFKTVKFYLGFYKEFFRLNFFFFYILIFFHIFLLNKLWVLGINLFFKNDIFDFILFESVFEFFTLKGVFFDFIFIIDRLNFWFIFLTISIILFVIISNFTNKINNYILFTLFFLILEVLVLLSFLSSNLLVFYLFFESSLIPMYFIIKLWGSRKRKEHAALLLVFYTLLGSFFIFPGILALYVLLGSTDFLNFFFFENIDFRIKTLIWFFLFFGFLFKVPTPPFHIWLTEAHTEAPTAGSMVLAAIILKLGGYGILRVIPTPFFSDVISVYLNYVIVIPLFGIFYSSFMILRQFDIKKIIAYSSIIHMNFGLLGIFFNNIYGYIGFLYSMISHGFISAGLFFLVGVVYDRYKTRNIKYYGGLSSAMPLYEVCFLLFLVSNMGFPILSGFIGEFLIIIGAIQVNFFLSIIVLLLTLVNVVFNIWLYNRIFGGLPIFFNKFYDLSARELLVSILLLLFIFILGIYPSLIISVVEPYFLLYYFIV